MLSWIWAMKGERTSPILAQMNMQISGCIRFIGMMVTANMYQG